METIPPPRNDLRDIAIKLGEVIKSIEVMTGYGRRTRRLTWVAIGTFIFDIVITILLAFSFSASQANTCHASNESRAGQVIIWHTIVTQFSDPHPSASQKLRQQRFLKFVDDTFHPISCRNFYWPWNR